MCICIYIMNCVFYPEKLGILPVVSQVLGLRLLQSDQIRRSEMFVSLLQIWWLNQEVVSNLYKSFCHGKYFSFNSGTE